MTQKIKITSKALPRIRVTSSTLEKIDPHMVAQALSGEPRGKMISAESGLSSQSKVEVEVDHQNAIR